VVDFNEALKLFQEKKTEDYYHFNNNEIREKSDFDSNGLISLRQGGPVFSPDNRTGIDGTLHRISCTRTRQGQIVGLVFRFGIRFELYFIILYFISIN
jgi:hypothetical protein